MGKRGNGEGSIFYQKARGRYAAAFLDLDGKRKWVYGKTRQDADRKLRGALKDRDDGIVRPSQVQTLGQYLEGWLADTIKPGRRPGTYLRYEAAVRLHIVPVIGKVKLAQVGPQHVQRLQRALLDKGLGKASIELVRATLGGALRQAMRWGLIVRNPVALVDPPHGEEKERQALLPEQASAFFRAAEGHEYQQVYAVMIATGLRIGEALGLRWRDVELERARLHVRQQLTVLPGEPISFTPPKSKYGRRTVPLVPQARIAFEQQRSKVQDYPVRALTDLVFVDDQGRPLVGRDVERKFKDVLKAAGLSTTFTPHSLRHSTATYLMAGGAPPKVIMELMGHSSLAMTAAYQHIADAVLDDAAERLAGMLPSVAVQ